jgi:4-hydroxythreonine-4-phosphate dehydrogenase
MQPIAVTMGEPSGIGGELTIKAWQARHIEHLPAFFALDDPDHLRHINPAIQIQEISEPLEAMEVFDEALPILPVKLNAPAQLGRLNPKNGVCVIKSIERAVQYCLEGQASALVTNPIHKAALYDVGFEHAGHTEFLAYLCGKNQTPIMMLTAKDLRVVPLTVHIPIKDVPSAITQDLIIEKAKIIHQSLQSDFKFASPRIAVVGLNPHAGEEGKIGVEDQEVIAPAIEKLKAEGLDITGPYPADTMFHEEARSQYDIALGMYHDQALIPLKTLDFHGGVNVTMGLSVVRTSPDHGTALDIAGQGIANPQSFINAIKMANEIAKNRER